MPVTIGRLGSDIVLPPGSVDLFVYLDAGGWASDVRTWGGLAVVGSSELVWLDALLAELKQEHQSVLTEDGELKGRDVALPAAQATGRRIRDMDRQVAFWAHRVPPYCSETMGQQREDLFDTLGSIRADSIRIDQRRYNDWYQGMADYFASLPETNQHKIVSVLGHLNWLSEQLQLTGLGRQLGTAALIIDRENFSAPERCAGLVKAFFAALHQGAEMSCRLNGAAPFEAGEEGNVTVEVHGDSHQHTGLQIVDILLQVVQRQLSRFESGQAQLDQQGISSRPRV